MEQSNFVLFDAQSDSFLGIVTGECQWWWPTCTKLHFYLITWTDPLSPQDYFNMRWNRFWWINLINILDCCTFFFFGLPQTTCLHASRHVAQFSLRMRGPGNSSSSGDCFSFFTIYRLHTLLAKMVGMNIFVIVCTSYAKCGIQINMMTAYQIIFLFLLLQMHPQIWHSFCKILQLVVLMFVVWLGVFMSTR